MRQFLKTYAVPYWYYYCLGGIALVVTNYIFALIPQKIKSAIDILNTVSPDYDFLVSVVVSIIVLSVGLLVARTLSRILIFIPGRNIEYDLRSDIYAHLLTLSPSFYRQQKVGDLMSRLVNDIQNLRLTAALGFLHILNSTMIYVFVIYQMLKTNLFLTAMVLVPTPLIIIAIWHFAGALHRHNRENQQKLGLLTDKVVQTLTNIQVIKSFAAEQLVRSEFELVNREYEHVNIELAKVRSTMFPFIATVGSFGHLLLFIFGGRLIISGQISLGDFVAMMAYVSLLAWPTVSLAWIINIFERGRVALKRINDIMTVQPDICDTSATQSNLQVTSPPAIKVQNLSFQYNGTPVLSDISFELEAGQTLGIFGPIGSGKSTLASILARFEDVAANTVYLDGIELHHWPLKSLRDSTSYVSQKPFLFSDSISENIRYGLDQRSVDFDEKMVFAARQSCVESEITHFIDQYDTMIGEKGIILSGGQKTRLSLARALYKPHHLLILDDVLAAVDHDTETTLIQNIRALKPVPTTVIISHRISALTHADQIIVLDKGRIVDKGTHVQLSGRDGIYRNTWVYQKMIDNE